jgi:dTDP-4-dehydrorhamnose reductase
MKIAHVCRKKNIRFIHFSTDYVFDGEKRTPYIETDKCNPLNIYGMSKYIGEEGILEVNPNASVLRVSGLYGRVVSRAKGYNFISLFLRKAKENDVIEVVSDEILTPTYTLNAAKQTLLVFENGISGIIHSTDEGEVSWFDFASEISRQMKLKIKVKRKKSSSNSIARPKYSVLENRKLNELGLNIMKDWRESLREFLKEEYI